MVFHINGDNMNKEQILKDVYNDFFGVEQEEIKQETKENIDMKDIFDKINELYIDEDSKDILKKIIEYQRKYYEGLETNYITFNIKINSLDKELSNSILDILKDSSAFYNYTDNTNIYKGSLYNEIEVENVYKNGLVLFTDFKGFELLDTKDKEKFIHSLKENLSGKTITLISDLKDLLNSFLNYNNELTDKYFTFTINAIKPNVQDIYNEIKANLDLTDEDSIKLLDYVSSTYENSSLDHLSYKNNLIDYISFNKFIPEIESPKSLDEIFKELDELVGLDKIKKTLRELVDLIELKKKNKDLNINSVNLHMVFLGNPGTGKTTVARLLAGILYNLKYIRKDKLIEVTSKDLVAEYVGQTAPKTHQVIEKAKGGILFIDEAYSLADKGGNSYNSEAIATLIAEMENNRDDLIVIFAGYTKEMQDFLDSNSGIVSRIGYTLEFEDYTEDELIKIFINMMTKAGFTVKDEALDRVRDLINEYKTSKNFGNARFIRNIYEKTVIKHAANTKDKKQKRVLNTITKADISDDGLIKE